MKDKYKWFMVLIGLCASNIALAGRHSIARDEAARIVENRFAQFYRDEAARKKAETDAMEREIAKAADLKAQMLRDLEQSLQSEGKSAEDIMKELQEYSRDLDEQNSADNTEGGAGSNGGAADFAGGSSWSDARNAQQNGDSNMGPGLFNLEVGTAENNPFLFLKELQDKDLPTQLAGIQEVIASFEGLPGQEQLAEQFAKDLAKMSPQLAANFAQEYKKHNQGNSKKANKKASKDSKQVVDSSTEQAGLVEKNINSQGTTKNKANNLSLSGEQSGQVANSFNSIMLYRFNADSLYQIYTAPGKATTIVLAPGEKIVGAPVCGDPTKWRIKTMVKGNGAERSWHLVVQPLRAGIKTSITIATDRNRLYALEATSLEDNYMAVVRWSYA